MLEGLKNWFKKNVFQAGTRDKKAVIAAERQVLAKEILDRIREEKIVFDACKKNKDQSRYGDLLRHLNPWFDEKEKKYKSHESLYQGMYERLVAGANPSLIRQQFEDLYQPCMEEIEGDEKKRILFHNIVKQHKERIRLEKEKAGLQTALEANQILPLKERAGNLKACLDILQQTQLLPVLKEEGLLHHDMLTKTVAQLEKREASRKTGIMKYLSVIMPDFFIQWRDKTYLAQIAKTCTNAKCFISDAYEGLRTEKKDARQLKADWEALVEKITHRAHVVSADEQSTYRMMLKMNRFKVKKEAVQFVTLKLQKKEKLNYQALNALSQFHHYPDEKRLLKTIRPTAKPTH